MERLFVKNIFSNLFSFKESIKKNNNIDPNSLIYGKSGEDYIIKKIENNNKEFKKFLFTLGCYEGEKITLISILGNSYIIKIKNSRYSINKKLASCIKVTHIKK